MKTETRNENPKHRQNSNASPADLTTEFTNGEAVRLHSDVEIYDTRAQRSQKIRIVMPDSVDLKKGCISVFSPLSTALLGHYEGDLVTMVTNGISRELKVIGVVNPKT